MADDTAALVLSLEARFDKFEKAMTDATKVVDRQTKIIEQRFDAMTKVISDKLGAIQGTLVNQIGAVGQAIAALGPAGIALAAAAGAAVVALTFLNEKADKFIEKQRQMKETAETAGVSLSELTQVISVARKAGLEPEEAGNFLNRLTIAINDLKTKGTGALVDQLVKIRAELVREVAAADSTAEAINIVARAYSELNTQIEKNALVSGIAGRRNIAAGRLLGQIAGAGGITLGEDKELRERNERLVATKKIIEDINRETDKIWGSAAAETRLRLLRTEAEQWNAIAKAARDIAAAAEKGPFAPLLERARIALGVGAGAAGRPPTAAEQVGARFPQPGEELGPLDLQEAARNRAKALAIQELEAQRARISVLGDAATEAEKLAVKELELNKALEDKRITTEVTTRALVFFNEQQKLATLSAKERLGISSQEEIAAARQIELQRQVLKGIITESDAKRALAIQDKENREKFEAQLVRASSTPGFTRLTLDATNFAKQVDTLAVSAVNHLTDAIFDAVSGAKSFEEAFKAMAQVVLQEIAKMAIKFALLQSFKIATGGSVLPGLAEGGPVLAGSPVVVGEAGPEVFMPSSSGFIMPNRALGGMGGGQNVNMGGFNIDARGAQAGVGDEILRKLRAEMPAIAVSSVSQAQRLGILRAQR